MTGGGQEDTSHFGFVVATHDGQWEVSLHHQCDRWDLTYPYETANRDAAIDAVNRFITEAQQALGYLRDSQEWRPEHRLDSALTRRLTNATTPDQQWITPPVPLAD